MPSNLSDDCWRSSSAPTATATSQRSRRRRAASWSARAAGWPTRSATASRCCSSTKPASRAERHPRWPPGSTSPGSTTSPSLAAADLRLRTLAESGARVRREAGEAAERDRRGRGPGQELARPRAVIAAGPDSRLLRAVLEPWCPVPVRRLARRRPCPGWAGSLDLVVVLAPDGSDTGTASAVAEAVPPRLPGGGRLPAGLDGGRARRRPLEHDPADGRPATSSPPPS